jgi:hypothetical protein
VQQGGKPGPVGLVEADPLPAELPLQYRELVAQSEDLCVLLVVGARQQPQDRERVGDAEVGQSQQHDAASSRSDQPR